MNPIHIIGIGRGKADLTRQHLDIIEKADVLVGGERLLQLFADHTGETLVIDRRIDVVMQKIKDFMTDRQVVVLASGDPLFYGIGSTLLNHFDKKDLRIYPNICCVSAAFAAIKEPWHDARIISFHSNSVPDFSFADLAFETKVAFLTNPKKDPGFIARRLMDTGVDGFQFCVLENIGYTPHQKITWFDSYTDVMTTSFSRPNMVILLKDGNTVTDVAHETPGSGAGKRPGNPNAVTDVAHEIHLGMDDDRFHHAKGLITKSEIRSISLSRLKLVKKDHVLWDIGSGSGSVSMEAALSIPLGKVFAIEKNKERTKDITHNIKKFRCSNVQVVLLDFPDGAQSLPSPDRIFVGGGGKNLDAVLDAACDHLIETGIIVINTVVIQNMERAFTCLEQKLFAPEMVQVQISRSRAMPSGTRLESLNPVWIIFGTKPCHKDFS